MWLFVLPAIVVSVVVGWWVNRTKGDKLDNLKGLRVIVTGASTGIGEQLAYEYAKQGATVVVTARRQPQLDQVVEKCHAVSPHPAPHAAFTCDMMEHDSIKEMMTNALDHLGGLDILVLNHMIRFYVGVFTGSDANVENMFDSINVNYISFVRTTALALPHLTKSKGRLVIMGSIAGYCGDPKLATYTATKFAIHGFYTSLHNQFLIEGRDVSITRCIIGMIDTPNTMESIMNASATSETTLKRIASPADECARAIVVSSARRDALMYYPQSARFVVLICRLFPSFMDFLLRKSSSDKTIPRLQRSKI